MSNNQQPGYCFCPTAATPHVHGFCPYTGSSQWAYFRPPTAQTSPNIPESFNVLIHELRGLVLDVKFES